VTAATTASSDQPADSVREGSAQRLWRATASFVVYVLTGGLYGIWWFFVSRQEMDQELGRKPAPGRALLEGIGQLIPVVNAYVWYRTITDMNTLRAKVRAPAVSMWGWVAALALAAPAVYLLPGILGPVLDAFNSDMRDIIEAVGYALFPAQVLVFGYMLGYWNEYWMEKHGDRVEHRPFGPVDILFAVLAVAGLAGIVIAAVSA
jgi:hypothetical protein